MSHEELRAECERLKAWVAQLLRSVVFHRLPEDARGAQVDARLFGAANVLRMA